VFTQPDRPAGRGQKLQPGPVKILAQARGIPVFQPERIRLEENRPILEGLHPDFIIVAAYGQILPGWLLRAARLAPINIHASLLPRYRGAAPVPWAIINGDTVTGVTTMVIHEKLDSGPILMQREVPIPLTWTAGELAGELSGIGAHLLIKTLDAWQTNSLNPVVQDESKISWAPRITKAMAGISWGKPAIEIHNQIRGMNPWPVAYSDFRGERLHIWRSLPESELVNSPSAPGTFLGLSNDATRVQCGAGTVLDLLEVQLPAKSRITGREFVSGARLRAGDTLF
ncbi:MAG: methionyl-tRNA formyltransferase, partial [Acidobacteria bacterium]|nr:methionyl-tRNA formyltransferase [Acidobacteriota bacterium]